MAYVRDKKEIIETDFPLSKVWATIKNTLTRLEWTIETEDESTHRMKARTKKSFLSYATLISIEAKAISENVTRVTLNAETPVTTLTSVLDFGKTQERLDLFLQALSIELNPENTKPKQKD